MAPTLPPHSSYVTETMPSEELHNVKLEDALNIIGFGRYQWTCAFIGGLAFLAAGVSSGISAFVLPSMKCDLALTSSQMGLINACFLVGGIGSGILWGTVVDWLGRKPVLYYALLMDSVVTFASSFAPNFYFFAFFRFLNGFIVGGPTSVALAHVGELIPQKQRSEVLCFTGLSWAVSWMISAGLAWMIIPMGSIFCLGLEISSWRIVLVVVAIIDVVAAIIYTMVYESPKFYLSKGQHEEALAVLASVYAKNKNTEPSAFPVKSLAPLENSSADVAHHANKSVWRPLMASLKQFRGLLQGPVLPTTMLVCFLWFTNMFGYYGLGLWLPELTSRYKTYEASFPSSTISVSELNELQVDGDSPICTTAVDGSVYMNNLLSAGSMVFGNFMAAVLIPCLPRTFLPIFFMFGASASVLALFIVESSMELLVVSSLFQLCIGTANLIQNVLVVDIFPPDICGRAICVAVMIGRVGSVVSNIVLGQLLDVSVYIPLVMCAVIIAAGGVGFFFIPRPYEKRPSIPS